MISSRPLRAVGLAALCAAAAAAFTAVIRSPGTATAESSGMTSRFIAARSVATMLNIGKVMGRLL
ncbi:MAG: hypothetical protein ABSG43_29170, partial [Solirubrobacteraceae bacterium]